LNQAIQFLERERWDNEQRAVCFLALVNGFQATCAISAETVASRYGGNDVQEWLAAFQANRWDIEEEALALILDEQEDHQGWYWVS
jgi:hypothetical protein